VIFNQKHLLELKQLLYFSRPLISQVFSVGKKRYAVLGVLKQVCPFFSYAL
jgi:hypothetical protein